MRVDPQTVIDDWEHAIQGELLDEPRYVQLAREQLEAERQIEGQHWLDKTMNDVEYIIAAAGQMELKLPKLSQRALARDRMVRFWQNVVAPFAISRKEATRHEKMKVCRRSARVGILPGGKMMLQWDEKAGLPLYDPDDAREEAMRLARRQVAPLLELLNRPGYRAYYLCGTAPNSPLGELAEGQRALYAKWYRLIRGCKRKRSPLFPIEGAVTVMESPLGRHRDWHPHLNAIVVCSGWLDFTELRKWWHWNIEMRPIDGHPDSIARAFREIIKYSCRTVSEKSHAKSQSENSDDGVHRLCGAAESDPEDLPGRRGDALHPDALSARESAGARAAAACAVGRDEREAPNSQTGQAPAMEEWSALEALEFDRAHQRFRRTRTYRALYGLPKPDPVDRSGIEWIGTLKRGATGFVASFALLESIPGDKSTPEDIRKSIREAWSKLLGPPDQVRRALQVAAMIKNTFGPVSLSV